MTLLHILDLLSTFVFALVGARVAADKSLDYEGIWAINSPCVHRVYVSLVHV